MLILDEKQIKQKINRMALEIAEHNYHMPNIILAGINNSGYGLAKFIGKSLKKYYQGQISLSHLHLNPANPTEHPITFDAPKSVELDNACIVIIDDVANTGRTIFYAFRPLMAALPAKVEVAVLVDRKHKRFPIQVDYVGMSLATTLQENIRVEILDTEHLEIHLE